MYRPLVARISQHALRRGCLFLGGVCSWGVSAPRGCLLLGGVCPGSVSQYALRQTPPCEQNDSQTGVKTLRAVKIKAGAFEHNLMDRGAHNGTLKFHPIVTPR